MTYLNFYGLNKQPFDVTPDPEFLYLGSGHKEALGALIYGITKRKGFILITGEVGLGKTTVLRYYLDQIDPQELKAIYLFNSNLSFPELLKHLYREFEMVPAAENTSDLLDGLHKRLLQEYKNRRNVAVIVDEAQNMPVETLANFRLLSNLETSKEKLLQIVLIGQPELEAKLDLQELRPLQQRIAIRARISPLNERESKDYLRHRLGKASIQSDAVFSSAATEQLTKVGKGIPRTLNILADNALITGFGYQQRPVSRRVVQEVVSDFTGAKPQTSHRWMFPALAVLLAIFAIYFAVQRNGIMTEPSVPKEEAITKPGADAKQTIAVPAEHPEPKSAPEETLVVTPEKAESPTPPPEIPASSPKKNIPPQSIPKKKIPFKTSVPKRAPSAIPSKPSPAKSLAEEQKDRFLRTQARQAWELKNGIRGIPAKSAKTQLLIPKKEEQVKPTMPSLSSRDEASSKATPQPEKEEASPRAMEPPVLESANKSATAANSTKTSADTSSDSDSKSDSGSKDIPTIDDPKPDNPSSHTVLRLDAMILPRLLERVQPAYPAVAARKGIGGTVTAKVLVSESGEVIAVQLIQGVPELNAAAISALEKWKFTAARQNGRRVKAWMTYALVFKAK